MLSVTQFLIFLTQRYPPLGSQSCLGRGCVSEPVSTLYLYNLPFCVHFSQFNNVATLSGRKAMQSCLLLAREEYF